MQKEIENKQMKKKMRSVLNQHGTKKKEMDEYGKFICVRCV
jgi:hypothetical protein